MITPEQAVSARKQYSTQNEAADALGISRHAMRRLLLRASERGLNGTEPVMPGFAITQVAGLYDADGELEKEWIKQRREHGEEFVLPPTHQIKAGSVLVDGEQRVIQHWLKYDQKAIDVEKSIRAMVDELKAELPRVKPTKGPALVNSQLLNQFTITDNHFGMLAWAEETRGADYDLKIAEQLLLDWFSSAIAMAPNAHTAVLAQLGDFMHHDAHESVTPAHKHVLDADSRLQKVIRVAIRLIRHVISMLLETHQRVHVVMATGNHDPASSAWMREWLAAMYENEPRITIDDSPDVYYAYEWGQTALFYHHGHRRKLNDVDTVFAGKFRQLFGRCEYSYGHIGHLHSDAVHESSLMRIERHRTLAAADAYASSGGWLSKRDAKVITYHKEFGEVSRITLSPQMVTLAN
jgi:hypothetical protein